MANGIKNAIKNAISSKEKSYSLFFGPLRKKLHEYAVPKAELINWSLQNPPNPSPSENRSAFISPLGESILSPVTPSAHVNKRALRRDYGKFKEPSNYE